jgi:phage-related tail fiber protein
MTVLQGTMQDGTVLPVQVDAQGRLVTDVPAVPVSTVIWVASIVTPAGWLYCNGQAVSRTVYEALFAAIGTTYGAGNGSTTFTLPDLRGEFVRGWDDGRAVDVGRVFGSKQSQLVPTHQHLMPFGWDGSSYYAWRNGEGSPIFGSEVDMSSSRFAFAMGGVGNSGRYALTDSVLRSQNGENRPRNIALRPLIRH